MLIVLFIYILKKLNIRSSLNRMITNAKRFAFSIIYLLFILMFTNITLDNIKKDVENVVFEVKRNYKSIGFINIEKYALGGTTIYNLNSEVNARVQVNFKAVGIEKSIYKNEQLIYSSVYREINKKVKLSHSILFSKGKYLLKENSQKEELELEIISQNLVKLFFSEPVGVQKVYSDKYRLMLNIIPLRNGMYKIVFPNGSYNIYHYKNGECAMIEVVGGFFKVKLKRI